ncbi:hypothetical protein IC235_09165 [Hymenobacter sp. BT664]|uniref:Uncharacterized protein n=1 Tax=Hymenobacter montanus TaxID=2771359 RepID=A0A927BDM6_9BACT|nr:hypothetical protein [Hymenobacter montanus]MBD2768058.1 hypothetical protein [Hymenobacter montanus]
MDIILNELSLRVLPTTGSHAAVLLDAWLTQLIGLAKVHKVLPAFRSLASVRDMQIAADGTFFQQWLGQLPTDRKRLALTFTTKAPFIHYYPEYWFIGPEPAGMRGLECKGLAFAAENNLLAWSLDPFGQWAAPYYHIHCTAIDEVRDALDEYELTTWHLPASGETSEHAAYYAGVLAAEEMQVVQAATSGNVLLQRWTEWFPKLRLTDIASECLRELTIEATRPVAERLIALHRFFAVWDRVPANYDQVLSYRTSPESDTRLRTLSELQLRCPDGQTRAMSWHMRYTPQAGRLYFVPDVETGDCFIGHIGHKII